MDSDAHIRTLSPRRHHDLDALRAWAMSMGIVLHAAWIMIPGEIGAPKTYASASQLTHYLCFVIHTFRMMVHDLAFHHGRGEPDYAGLREQLLSADADAIPAILLELLPEPNREFIQSQESATENQLNGLLQAINLFVLTRTELAERVETGRLALSEPARAIAALPANQRRKEQNERLNREILEAGLPGVIHREARRQPHYHILRAAYAYCYALISWLLVFGCHGLFRTYCHGESRFWRYFSDASYWFYLAHLPIQFQVLIWFGDKPWPWPV